MVFQVFARNPLRLLRPVGFSCDNRTCFSTANSLPDKSVFISQSTDIYSNLALEDWLYRHQDFERHRVLLLWSNRPTVVIGRHQNLWTEVNLQEADRRGVIVARRNSGGGAVYHDQGNLNCSFFTPRTDYNRRFNLGIIQRALRQLGLYVETNCKDDLILGGSKISGTASKLGKTAYHHCTLLVDSDLKTLTNLLNPNVVRKKTAKEPDGITSRATKSKKSPVTNLKSYKPDITVPQVLHAIGQEFLTTVPNNYDGVKTDVETFKNRGFQMINPTEEWFPGLAAIQDHFSSYEWTFAKTPDFTVTKSVPAFNGLGANVVEFKVVKGIVQSPSITLPLGTASTALDAFRAFLDTAVEGQGFTVEILKSLDRWQLPEQGNRNMPKTCSTF